MSSSVAGVGGIRHRWLELGAGFPVVYVHGIPTSPELWRRVMVMAGGRSLAWEMVGYGRSIDEGRERDISVAHQAGYLLQWLDELRIERAILVGHDLGGGVVQVAATRRRSICAGIVLTNSIGYDSWPIPSIAMMQRVPGLVAGLPRPLFRLIFESFLRRGHDDQRVASASLAIHWANYDRPGGTAAFAREVASLRVDDTLAVAPDLPALKVPARVVWGEADGFQVVRYGERFARDLGCQLERIPGGRHFTPEDHPQPIAAAVNELLAGV